MLLGPLLFLKRLSGYSLSLVCVMVGAWPTFAHHLLNTLSVVFLGFPPLVILSFFGTPIDPSGPSVVEDRPEMERFPLLAHSSLLAQSSNPILAQGMMSFFWTAVSWRRSFPSPPHMHLRASTHLWLVLRRRARLSGNMPWVSPPFPPPPDTSLIGAFLEARISGRQPRGWRSRFRTCLSLPRYRSPRL